MSMQSVTIVPFNATRGPFATKLYVKTHVTHTTRNTHTQPTQEATTLAMPSLPTRPTAHKLTRTHLSDRNLQACPSTFRPCGHHARVRSGSLSVRCRALRGGRLEARGGDLEVVSRLLGGVRRALAARQRREASRERAAEDAVDRRERAEALGEEAPVAKAGRQDRGLLRLERVDDRHEDREDDADQRDDDAQGGGGHREAEE